MLAKTVIISSEQPHQVATVLKLQPPQKHVDKSQKQQFVVEFPPEVTQTIGSVCMINVDRKHFLPPVLLTGIAKQQKEEKKNINNFPIQGKELFYVITLGWILVRSLEHNLRNLRLFFSLSYLW